MQDPGAAFNLRKFPPDQREHFVNAVTRGKNQMPPWGDFFKPEQLEALWAYVMAGEREPLFLPSLEWSPQFLSALFSMCFLSRS